jgi:sulfatase maturation enzyme AslB (radical SAM superfamily)
VPHKGRGSCQYRDLCSRGCPFGAYFSTQSSTLPAAMATKRLIDPIPLLITSFMIKTLKKSKRSYGYRCGD